MEESVRQFWSVLIILSDTLTVDPKLRFGSVAKGDHRLASFGVSPEAHTQCSRWVCVTEELVPRCARSSALRNVASQ